MQSTVGMRLNLTRTACKRAVGMGLTPERIQSVFDNPSSVTPNPEREGQYQITGDGIAFVGVFDGNRFVAITIKRV